MCLPPPHAGSTTNVGRVLPQLANLEPSAEAGPTVGLVAALDPMRWRPRLRPDAECLEHTTRWGRREAIVHVANSPYLRISGREIDFVHGWSGNVEMADLMGRELERADGLSVEAAAGLVDEFRAAGLLTDRPVDVVALITGRLSPRQARVAARVRTLLRTQTVAVAGVDEMVGRLNRALGRWVFSVPAVALGSVTIVVGAISLTTHTPHGPLGAAGGMWLFALLLVAIFLHELGHALAVHRAKRRVIRAGFRLYLGHPAFFVDSTDLVFGNPAQRAVNAAAGPFVEAVVAGVAGLALYVWPQSVVLDRFGTLALFNVALNLIPFIELDGYWLLTDLLDVPRLRQRSLAELRNLLTRRRQHQPLPVTSASFGLALFAAVGIVVSTLAVAIAFRLWWPIVGGLSVALWARGWWGRVGLVLVLLLAVGPLLEPAWKAAAAAWRGVATTVQNIVFRLQSSWRVSGASLIASLPGMEGIDDEALSDLAGRLSRRRVPGGSTLFRERDEASEFFVVAEGLFELAETDESGQERVIARRGKGTYFGEIALLTGGRRTATVRAVQPSELFVVDAATFKRLVGPSLASTELDPAAGPALRLLEHGPLHALSFAQATSLVPHVDVVHLAPGTDAVTQADTADAFFVIISGRAEVLRDGRHLADLSAGDHFGEIALLQSRTRTATVRTLSPLTVLRVEGAAFRDIVAGVFEQSDLHHVDVGNPAHHLDGQFS
jgi:CRP-like cAMP-binding protein